MPCKNATLGLQSTRTALQQTRGEVQKLAFCPSVAPLFIRLSFDVLPLIPLLFASLHLLPSFLTCPKPNLLPTCLFACQLPGASPPLSLAVTKSLRQRTRPSRSSRYALPLQSLHIIVLTLWHSQNTSNCLALKLGFYAAQADAALGCPSKISYTDPSFKNFLIATAAKHGIYKSGAKPPSSTLITFANDLGIQTCYGPHIWVDIMKRVTGAMDRFGPDGSSPHPTQVNSRGQKIGWTSIINSANAILAGRDAFSAPFPNAGWSFEAIPSQIAATPTSSGRPVMVPAPGSNILTPPATPRRSQSPVFLQTPSAPAHAGTASRIDDHDTRLNRHRQQINTNTSRLDTHEGRLDTHETRLDRHRHNIDTNTRRVNTHEGRLNGVDSRLERHRRAIDTNHGRLSTSESRLAALDSRVNGTTQQINTTSDRLRSAESLLCTHDEAISDHASRAQDTSKAVNNLRQGTLDATKALTKGITMVGDQAATATSLAQSASKDVKDTSDIVKALTKGLNALQTQTNTTTSLAQDTSKDVTALRNNTLNTVKALAKGISIQQSDMATASKDITTLQENTSKSAKTLAKGMNVLSGKVNTATTLAQDAMNAVDALAAGTKNAFALRDGLIRNGEVRDFENAERVSKLVDVVERLKMAKIHDFFLDIWILELTSRGAEIVRYERRNFFRFFFHFFLLWVRGVGINKKDGQRGKKKAKKGTKRGVFFLVFDAGR
ncbi:uncharacterized protein MYCFIDRAFT_180239 [Pseudocercospora fijiensis CIRAD86]|uniref:Uncharacterized protein n=1 Tax=Pseudocercospora fijiensis (strain CIRAD86) TaxID=383855 RepID=M2YGZ4_PSEFD|nr:uncharacterized protein MYCFIDRAFT_180239 [Pseudocercospora fijiensis CIRAD86]EME77095.1 hypothetical protein MYCFIDRAFT_180239 [Pseudocercospora fijiensis CIRAD86]